MVIRTNNHSDEKMSSPPNSSCAAAPRRTSINDELLRFRFSSTSFQPLDKVSESLLAAAATNNNDDDARDVSSRRDQIKNLPAAHYYGSVAEIESPHPSSDYDANHNHNHQQQHRRFSLAEDSNLLKDEMKSMIELAIPVIVTYLLEMLPGITTIILVGRLNDKVHMDATALAVMFVNMTGMSTGLGLLTAMDTLCSHAHGANQPMKMGTYLLTGMFVMTITFIIVACIIWNTTPILLAFGQHHNVAMEASQFSRFILPSIPFIYAYELFRKISQARNEATPMIISAVVSNIVNIGLGNYLVNYTSWGWLGAAVAKSVGAILMLPTLILSMMYCEKGEEKMMSNVDVAAEYYDNEIHDGALFQHLWEGFQPSQALSFKSILRFLDLGVPGMLQVMFEWVAFELIALLCGIIPNQEEALIAIGSNAVVYNVSSFAFMLYLGTSVAGNVRIGNALGAGDAHRAEVACGLGE